MPALKYQFDLAATSYQRYAVAPRLQKVVGFQDLGVARRWLSDVFGPNGWLVIRKHDVVTLYSPAWDGHRPVATVEEVQS